MSWISFQLDRITRWRELGSLHIILKTSSNTYRLLFFQTRISTALLIAVLAVCLYKEIISSPTTSHLENASSVHDVCLLLEVSAICCGAEQVNSEQCRNHRGRMHP